MTCKSIAILQFTQLFTISCSSIEEISRRAWPFFFTILDCDGDYCGRQIEVGLHFSILVQYFSIFLFNKIKLLLDYLSNAIALATKSPLFWILIANV